MTYQDRLLKVIPGGAHTYSRGYDQYPINAPQILKRGKDAYIYDEEENKFLDYGMALRAVNLGYANEQVNNAAIKQIEYGNNLTKNLYERFHGHATLFKGPLVLSVLVSFTKVTQL